MESVRILVLILRAGRPVRIEGRATWLTARTAWRAAVGLKMVAIVGCVCDGTDKGKDSRLCTQNASKTQGR